jgi:hypothetical protein
MIGGRSRCHARQRIAGERGAASCAPLLVAVRELHLRLAAVGEPEPLEPLACSCASPARVQPVQAAEMLELLADSIRG